MNPILRNCCKYTSSIIVRSYSSFSNPSSRRVTEVFHDTPRVLKSDLVRTRLYSTQNSSKSSNKNKFIAAAGAMTLLGVGAYIYNQSKKDDSSYRTGDELTIPRDINFYNRNELGLLDIIGLMVKNGDKEALQELIRLLHLDDHFQKLGYSKTYIEENICEILIENRNIQLIRDIFPLFDKKIIYNPCLLYDSIKEGNLELLKVLIELGVPLSRDFKNHKDDHLLMAVLFDQMEIVKFLLRSGFEMNKPSPISTIRISLVEERFVDNKITPAFLAVYKNNPETLKKLLALGADISLADKYNPLFYSILHGNKECFKVMVQPQFNLNFSNAKGQTPLMVAAEKGRNDMVVRLLESGADPKCMDNDQNTLWSVAATSSRLSNDKIWIILKERIPESMNNENKEGLTPLLQAISQYNSEAVKALIELGATTTCVLKLDLKSCTALGFKEGEEITAIQFTLAKMHIVKNNYRFKHGEVEFQVKYLELKKIMQELQKGNLKYFNEDISPGSR